MHEGGTCLGGRGVFHRENGGVLQKFFGADIYRGDGRGHVASIASGDAGSAIYRGSNRSLCLRGVSLHEDEHLGKSGGGFGEYGPRTALKSGRHAKGKSAHRADAGLESQLVVVHRQRGTGD